MYFHAKHEEIPKCLVSAPFCLVSSHTRIPKKFIFLVFFSLTKYCMYFWDVVNKSVSIRRHVWPEKEFIKVSKKNGRFSFSYWDSTSFKFIDIRLTLSDITNADWEPTSGIFGGN